MDCGRPKFASRAEALKAEPLVARYEVLVRGLIYMTTYRKAGDPPDDRMRDETGWVIVRDLPGTLGYFDGAQFATDNLVAIRFARREDAERMLKRLHGGSEHPDRVEEHRWMAGSTDGRESQDDVLPHPTELMLRRLLAASYAGALIYHDDGELQDNRRRPFIDFRRDTPTEIGEKMYQRTWLELKDSPLVKPTVPPDQTIAGKGYEPIFARARELAECLVARERSQMAEIPSTARVEQDIKLLAEIDAALGNRRSGMSMYAKLLLRAREQLARRELTRGGPPCVK